MKIKNNMKKISFIGMVVVVLLGAFLVSAANPGGPDTLVFNSNTTKSTPSAATINISGGYVASINLTANIQDTRWKAFVGKVTGSFTLQDGTGSTIYNWALSTITGRVYTTRIASALDWGNVNCSNLTFLNQENANMNHLNPNDNLNMTFNYSTGATHNSFYVGTRNITANSCPTLNTYVNNASQDTNFEEMALYDGSSAVYATTIDPNKVGYNGQRYDFQMIVPEDGSPSFTGATAYYLYVEIGT